MSDGLLVSYDKEANQLTLSGNWDCSSISLIRSAMKDIKLPKSKQLQVDGQSIKKMDTAGAWQLLKILTAADTSNASVNYQNFSSEHEKLIQIVSDKVKATKAFSKIKSLSLLASLGRVFFIVMRDVYLYLVFIGNLTSETIRLLFRPTRMRFGAFASVIFRCGFEALPIVALLLVMIGVVITYQMGLQLKNYGANVYIVDLLGHSVLREFGPLITAIIVAGRTGSAFTAQLGLMKVNQEIDALNTMGVTPAELLLLPRIFGLIITMPLLTVWADAFGVFGGMLMSASMLNISWYDFLHRFPHVIPLKALLIGIGKAPVFAFIISTIGCFQGMSVENNADSVGKHTTRSVVHSIFFIIIVDAIFSVILSELKL